MRSITNNELLLVLRIFKSPEKDFNANNIAKHIGISSMGALKISKSLEKDGILKSKIVGKAIIYKINFNNGYAKDYVRFALKRESQQAHPYTKRWISEIKKLTNAKAGILFGSVLRENKKARDIDLLLVTNKETFSNLQKQVEEINGINIKKIHPVYQTKEDIIRGIGEENKVILNAIKGIVAFGEDLVINILEQ